MATSTSVTLLAFLPGPLLQVLPFPFKGSELWEVNLQLVHCVLPHLLSRGLLSPNQPATRARPARPMPFANREGRALLPLGPGTGNKAAEERVYIHRQPDLE